MVGRNRDLIVGKRVGHPSIVNDVEEAGLPEDPDAGHANALQVVWSAVPCTFGRGGGQARPRWPLPVPGRQLIILEAGARVGSRWGGSAVPVDVDLPRRVLNLVRVPALDCTRPYHRLEYRQN
eukprot:SAG31_NODE_1292_length_8967_cov_2.998985_1_plen_123_part_00